MLEEICCRCFFSLSTIQDRTAMCVLTSSFTWLFDEIYCSQPVAPRPPPRLPRPCYLGTGKSTTIYHVIESRVQKDARVLITSIRNQAIDAVTEKVDSFGVLVSCVVLGYENQASSTVCLCSSSRGISGVSTNAYAPGVVEAFTRGLRSRGQSA